MRVVPTEKNNPGNSPKAAKHPSTPLPTEQEVIDQILDKISHSGYDSLTKSEKEALFKVSKQDQN